MIASSVHPRASTQSLGLGFGVAGAYVWSWRVLHTFANTRMVWSTVVRSMEVRPSMEMRW
jgi:hypothetical protein